MIVGSGMVAQSMHGISVPDDVVIFAAGESNSRCRDAGRFQRERQLLCGIRDSRLIVYFSTISALHERKTPYTEHKLAMEELVRGGQHLILRLPNLVGPCQTHYQLIPSLVEQVRRGAVTIHAGAVRDLLDVVDLARMLPSLLNACSNMTVNLSTGHYVPVDEIVNYIARLLNTSPAIRRVRVKGSDYPVVSMEKLASIIDFELFGFGPAYYRDVLDRYVYQD